MDDCELLDRARRGDEDAFGQLFARHQRAIFRYAAHMCGRDAGDDIVQETFLAVLKQTGRYDSSRGTVSAYLFGIARHCALKRTAAGANRRGDEEIDEAVDVSPACAPTVLEELSRTEAVEALRAAVDSLPAIYREAIVLCELEEMDYAAAAGIMQCPVGTVRSRLHRAKALLADKLAAKPMVSGSRS